ncbi:hypothetical protein AB6D20_028005 (plasmid) [Vibrio splendidus]
MRDITSLILLIGKFNRLLENSTVRKRTVNFWLEKENSQFLAIELSEIELSEWVNKQSRWVNKQSRQWQIKLDQWQIKLDRQLVVIGNWWLSTTLKINHSENDTEPGHRA